MKAEFTLSIYFESSGERRRVRHRSQHRAISKKAGTPVPAEACRIAHRHGDSLRSIDGSSTKAVPPPTSPRPHQMADAEIHAVGRRLNAEAMIMISAGIVSRGRRAASRCKLVGEVPAATDVQRAGRGNDRGASARKRPERGSSRSERSPRATPRRHGEPIPACWPCSVLRTSTGRCRSSRSSATRSVSMAHKPETSSRTDGFPEKREGGQREPQRQQEIDQRRGGPRAKAIVSRLQPIALSAAASCEWG